MNEQQHASELDHESDPARTPGNGWVDEGGASHLGPATHLTHDTGLSESEEAPEEVDADAEAEQAE